MIGEGDASGMFIGARVYDNGSPVALGGSCVGKIVRADGATVPLTGAITGNLASVVLDQTSCAIEGPIQVAVCWVSGTTITTLLLGYGSVVHTQTGNAIQPSEPIPDLTQLLAEIDRMREATAAAEAVASTQAVRYDIAQTLDDEEKATALSNIGAASAVAVEAINNEMRRDFIVDPTNVSTWQQGGLDVSTGAEVDSSARCRTIYFPVRRGDVIHAQSPSSSNIIMCFFAYDTTQAFLASPGTFAADINYTITADGYARIAARLISGATITPSDVTGIVTDGLSILQPNVENMLKNTLGEISYNFEFGGISLDGSLVSNTIRARTVEIPVNYTELNRQLKFTCNGSYLPATFVFYLRDGSVVSHILTDYAANEPITLDMTEDYRSFRFSLKRANDAEFTQQEVAALSIRVTGNNVATIEFVNRAAEGGFNLWAGKKYAALGDSITYGYIPRNYTGYPGQLNSYAKLTAEKLGMTFENYGISGSTLAYHSSRNPMSRRYQNLPDDADLITVMGGTNDIRNGIQLGTMADRTDATYYGALHVILGGLYKKYMIDQGVEVGKTKTIVVLTPIKLLASSSSTQGGTGTLVRFDPWIAAVKEVAAYYSIPCFDFYNLSGINPHLDETIHGWQDGYTGYYNPYITDGTHPTQEGAEIMAEAFSEFLKTGGHAITSSAINGATIILNCGAVSSLPTTVTDSRITADMVVLQAELSNPGAQGGDWTVTATDGSLTISGTITGSTTIKLYLMEG
jgi:lysophospholipase L1-like esterase